MGLLGSVLGGIAGSFVGQPMLGATIGGAIGNKNKASKQQVSGDGGGPEMINTLTPDQSAVSSLLTKILMNGAAKYGGPRVAGMGSGEDYTQNYLRNALQTAAPGINRQLSGEFPEEYFNQAIADPTRRQFNDRVAPVIRENSELTGNRFADRSAIEMGQARGDVENGILQQRGQFGLDTYRDPLNAATQLTGALQGAESVFSVPRTIEQAKLDADFQEFLRTNPESGGLIDAMLSFTGQGQNAAYVPQTQESMTPSLIQTGANLLGGSALTGALQPNASGANGAAAGNDIIQKLLSKYSLTSALSSYFGR